MSKLTKAILAGAAVILGIFLFFILWIICAICLINYPTATFISFLLFLTIIAGSLTSVGVYYGK